MKNARQYLLGLLLGTLASGGHTGQPIGVNTGTEAAAAKAAITDLSGALQAELKNALHAGGPAAAVAVCNTQAMPITARVSADHGMTINRVSLKNRNPANAPNHWQKAVLQEFEHRLARGQDVTTITWSETVDVDGAREYRFMKAIPTGGVCLACHGAALSPEISRVLAELYPNDLATGFNEGDIRGAFVVTQALTW